MPRKPMTEEQRAAAVERLAKAREARGYDGSKSVHENLRDMDKDSPIPVSYTHLTLPTRLSV